MGGFTMNLSEILLSIEGAEQEFVNKAKERTAQLVMPQRALGELHIIGERLCGILRTSKPSVSKKALLIAAGDHGIAASGVSAYPQIVTGEMVKTFMNGGAGISVLARHIGAEVTVLDAGIIPDISPETNNNGRLIVNKVAKGTYDFSKGPAMDRKEAESSILAGFRAAGVLFETGVELLTCVCHARKFRTESIERYTGKQADIAGKLLGEGNARIAEIVASEPVDHRCLRRTRLN